MEGTISQSRRTTKHTVWVIAELSDVTCGKIAAERIERVVQEFRGEVVEASCLFDTLSIKATFPHRRYEALVKAIGAALVGLPVGGMVLGQKDPASLRLKKNPAV
jgi:hypothetical protein